MKRDCGCGLPFGHRIKVIREDATEHIIFLWCWACDAHSSGCEFRGSMHYDFCSCDSPVLNK